MSAQDAHKKSSKNRSAARDSTFVSEGSQKGERADGPYDDPGANQSLTLKIPLTPSYVLNPNRNRQGFQSRYAVKDAETQLMGATKSAICNARATYAYGRPEPDPVFTTPVRVDITVYKKKGGQTWDDDNFKSACKRGVFDVLQAQGIVENDRLLRIMPVEWERDPDGLGYMVLVLTAVT